METRIVPPPAQRCGGYRVICGVPRCGSEFVSGTETHNYALLAVDLAKYGWKYTKLGWVCEQHPVSPAPE